MWTRREFGKMTLAGVAGSICSSSALNSILSAAERPNSFIDGVQIGAITYSYRSMPDQSAEATLKYLLGSGLSACELMDGPAELFAGRPQQDNGGRGGGFGGGGGRRGAPPALEPGPGQKIAEWHGQQCLVS